MNDSADSTFPVVVSVADLHNGTSENTVIFDCRFSLVDTGLGLRSYEEGHIPGAIYLDMENDLAAPVSEHGGRHPLPAIEDFQATLRRAGVSSDSHVICYDEQRFAGAARAWWVLRYYGIERVSVLDGGIAAWRAAGHPLSTEHPDPRAGDVVLGPDSSLLADRMELVGEPGMLVVDSREPGRFAGAEEPIDPIAGRVPAASNFCWLEISDEQGFAKPVEFHRQRWSGIPEGGDAIVYCGSGVTAAVNLLSMAIAGVPGGRLYAGSWSDWITWPDSLVASDEHPEGVPVSELG